MNKEQKAFEEWASKEGYCLIKDGFGVYVDDNASGALKIWIAALDWKSREKKTRVNPVDIKKIFDHWCCRMRKGPTCKLTPERRRAVSNRIGDGYSLDDIKQAIDNCSRSGFHMGQNDQGRQYNDLTLICRNGAKLEQFRDMNSFQEKTVKNSSIIDNLTDRDWAFD